ncbi:MAG: sulfotransferase [Chloroflexota bacterium]|nr:sulfotransferase [Chloroflexota bacterium]
MITIIGRGHSGTRAISHTLYGSGVYMGALLNPSGDLMPPQAMYEACRIMATYVRWNADLTWDFSALHTMDIPREFSTLIASYLESVLDNDAEHKGWKIPETTLVYPWIRRLYPDVRYIFWVRNPRDCILNRHITDNLQDFGVPSPVTDDVRLQRAISWKYQYDLLHATPRPAHWIDVRFEDFVLKQEETLKRLESFLDIPLARIITRPDSVNRWKQDTGVNYYDFLEPFMREYDYEIPEGS